MKCQDCKDKQNRVEEAFYYVQGNPNELFCIQHAMRLARLYDTGCFDIRNRKVK